MITLRSEWKPEAGKKISGGIHHLCQCPANSSTQRSWWELQAPPLQSILKCLNGNNNINRPHEWQQWRQRRRQQQQQQRKWVQQQSTAWATTTTTMATTRATRTTINRMNDGDNDDGNSNVIIAISTPRSIIVMALKPKLWGFWPIVLRDRNTELILKSSRVDLVLA